MILSGLLGNIAALQADTIFTNFGAGDTYSASSGALVASDLEAWSSVAVAFTPDANYDLTSIEFVSTDLFANDPYAVTIGIFADNGSGLPWGAPLESFTTGPLGQFGNTVLPITVESVLQPTLLAGTQYWIGMNAAPGDLVIWNQSVTGATGFAVTDGAGNWSAADPFQAQPVLQVDAALSAIQPLPPSPVNSTDYVDYTSSNSSVGSTPEPATFWLTVAGFSVTLLLFRRRATPAPLPLKTTTP